jgi:hypothetical protein
MKWDTFGRHLQSFEGDETQLNGLLSDGSLKTALQGSSLVPSLRVVAIPVEKCCIEADLGVVVSTDNPNDGFSFTIHDLGGTPTLLQDC